jgi:hypothetical protein
MTGTICPNCDTPLHGSYCSTCGQHQRRYDQAFSQLVSEGLGDIFRLDARGSKTLLSLLFRPGQLIVEFLAGARARFISPVRLYLVVSLLLFLLISIGPEDRSEHVVEADHAALHDAIMEYIILDGVDGPLTQYAQEQILKMMVLGRSNPQLLFDQYVDLLATVMFFMIPIFAIFVKLFYLGSRYFYTEHLIVCVYLQSFIYIAFSMLLVLGFFGDALDGIDYAIQLWIPVYIFISIRVVYRQSYFLTVSKYVILTFVYFSLFITALLASFVWQATTF